MRVVRAGLPGGADTGRAFGGSQGMFQPFHGRGVGRIGAGAVRTAAETLGGLDNLTIFPNMPGDAYTTTADQIERFAAEVLPALR